MVRVMSMIDENFLANSSPQLGGDWSVNSSFMKTIGAVNDGVNSSTGALVPRDWASAAPSAVSDLTKGQVFYSRAQQLSCDFLAAPSFSNCSALAGNPYGGTAEYIATAAAFMFDNKKLSRTPPDAAVAQGSVNGNLLHTSTLYNGTLLSWADLLARPKDPLLMPAAFPKATPCNAMTLLPASRSGTFSDGHAPAGYYLDSTNCGWLIEPSSSPPSSKLVALNLTFFSSERGVDTLRVYAGIDAISGTLLGVVTGRLSRSVPASALPVFQAAGPLFVAWETDSSPDHAFLTLEEDGFQATYVDKGGREGRAGRAGRPGRPGRPGRAGRKERGGTLLQEKHGLAVPPTRGCSCFHVLVVVVVDVAPSIIR
jgi:hypothetical protein